MKLFVLKKLKITKTESNIKFVNKYNFGIQSSKKNNQDFSIEEKKERKTTWKIKVPETNPYRVVFDGSLRHKATMAPMVAWGSEQARFLRSWNILRRREAHTLTPRKCTLLPSVKLL